MGIDAKQDLKGKYGNLFFKVVAFSELAAI